jgi:hypothetical protein
MRFNAVSRELRAAQPFGKYLRPPVEKIVDIEPNNPHKNPSFPTCQFLYALINLESPLFIYQKRSLHTPCPGSTRAQMSPLPSNELSTIPHEWLMTAR